MDNFNPDNIGIPNGKFFGFPYTEEESDILLISVPWDVTTSFMPGTAQGPKAILEASMQMDLFDEEIPNAWHTKIGTIAEDSEIEGLGKSTRVIAEEVIAELSAGSSEQNLDYKIEQVNEASEKLNDYVYRVSKSILDKGKIAAVVGGEHSVPLGLIKALAEKYNEFGILHIDAHADLRDAYEGFTYSHASIMFNVLQQIPNVNALTQVGIRDFCESENKIIHGSNRVKAYSDRELSTRLFEGDTWKSVCDEIIGSLPYYVYVSFDIDGLDASLCPNTGTPVPGGLSYNQASYLLKCLANSGKKIIGFDLCEVANGGEISIDANVGARILYKLCLSLNSVIN